MFFLSMEELTTYFNNQILFSLMEGINGYAMVNFLKQMDVIKQKNELTDRQVVESMLICVF